MTQQRTNGTPHQTTVITPPPSVSKQQATLKQLRREALLRYRPALQQGQNPIRVMARMVADVEEQCRDLKIPEEMIQAEVANRTIGDVDLRRVVECEGEPGGCKDYRMLADEVGIALPGEHLHGEYIASGKTYLLLRHLMMEYERLLLNQQIDVRLYDLLSIGNPVLRSWLAESWQQWGISVGTDQVYLSLGAVNGIDKILKGFHLWLDSQGISAKTLVCPAPGFSVPEQQAHCYRYRLHRIQASPQQHFKCTAAQLDEALQQAADSCMVYLIITNNPTAFAFTPDELHAIHMVLRKYWESGREVLILADLAYIGTGPVEEDRARMKIFSAPELLEHTIFVSSFSKTLSLTGDAMGWVTIGNPRLARFIAPGWSSSIASLPAEWQLRFMAYVRYVQDNPWLLEKIRNLYRLRRRQFMAELQHLNERERLFDEMYLDNDATIYTWSKLCPGEDAFSLFEKVGLAGVPGSGFGYSNEYVRFSIGIHPVTPHAETQGRTRPLMDSATMS